MVPAAAGPAPRVRDGARQQRPAPARLHLDAPDRGRVPRRRGPAEFVVRRLGHLVCQRLDAASVPAPVRGIARRPLHFIILADCSGGMKGEKIQALNFAIADMLPRLAAWERDQEQAQVCTRAIAFATEPWWHMAEPQPVAELAWKPLQPVPKGLTNMGPAFALAAQALASGRIERGRL